MFKSITFPLKGTGYIFDEFEKPEKPTRYSRGCRTDEDYDKAVEEWKKETKEWKSLQDKHVHLYLYKNLAGKTFTFAEDKINVIFGPNGSGKTTILKALAGEAFCNDGFLSLGEPLQIGGWGDEKTEEEVIRYKEGKKCNTCEVVWTGNPVYYDNFEQTYRQGYGFFGGIAGSALGDSFDSEMAYRLGVQTISAGQNTAFIFSKILARLKEAKTVKALIEQKYASQMKRANSTWRNCWQAQIDYLSKHEDFDKEVPVSVIFDEMDKSLDITKVVTVYTKLFPAILEKTGMQIITVSHSPVILSNEIFNNPKYNIISIDDAYTAEARVQLSQLNFKA